MDRSWRCAMAKSTLPGDASIGIFRQRVLKNIGNGSTSRMFDASKRTRLVVLENGCSASPSKSKQNENMTI